MPEHDKLFAAIRKLRVGRSISVPIRNKTQLEDCVLIYRGRTIKKRFDMSIDSSGQRFRVRRAKDRP